MNILTIDEINDNPSQTPFGRDITVKFECSVKATIRYMCDEHGHVIASEELTFHSTAGDWVSGIKTSIEGMFKPGFKDYERDIAVFAPKCNCRINKENIVFSSIGLQEPFKSLFEDLFQANKWKVQKEVK